MDYSLWIAILALLLSALSLWLSFQKYSYEKRVYLADRIKELKSVCADSIESIEESIRSIKERSAACKRGNDNLDRTEKKLQQLKSKYSSLYSNMENIKQKNPIALKSSYVDAIRLLKLCNEVQVDINIIYDSCQTCIDSDTKDS